MKNKEKKPGLNILGLDTSSRMLTLACSDRRLRVSEANLQGELEHSENLFPLMEGVLSSLSLALGDVDAYAVGSGPGSFTGLRIGFSVLKGLLAAHPRPVYGVSSLDLIAAGISLSNGRLVVALNARRERLYCAFYRFSSGQMERESREDEVLSAGELSARLEGSRLEEIHIAGDALGEYGDFILKNQPKAVFIPENFWYPRAGHLVRLVQSRYSEMRPLEAAGLKPAYLRYSEAEEKKLGNIHSQSG